VVVAVPRDDIVFLRKWLTWVWNGIYTLY